MFKKTVMSFALALLVTSATTVSANEMMMMDSSINSNLSVGSRGAEVVKLQSILESKGYLMIPVGISKGYFGQLTKMAVMKFQRDNGVSSTGYFGAMSRMKIKSLMSMNSMNNEQGVMVGGEMMLPSRDIVDNAVLANNVTTVVAAVKAAGLVDTLKSAGPFTVFAPTNDAFAKLPAGTVETLIKPENKATLTDILTYHVVAGRYTSADLTDGLVLTTVEGKQLKFSRVNGQIAINGNVMIDTPDVISKNGVTHVINTVMLPPEGVMVGGALMVKNLDIVENALNANNVTTVVAAVKAAGLVDTLKSAGPFTVFAPTNDAFAKLPAGTVETLIKPENKATLTGILTYHVIAGRYTAADISNGLKLKTVNGKELTFSKDSSGHIMINGNSKVLINDIISKNGVTFAIDTVLLP